MSQEETKIQDDQDNTGEPVWLDASLDASQEATDTPQVSGFPIPDPVEPPAPDVTLKSFRLRRAELEHYILQAILEFETVTGARVTSVELKRVEQVRPRQQPIRQSILDGVTLRVEV